MDSIQIGLNKKAEEINQLKADIDLIIKDSDALKPAVKEFEEKRQKANTLRKTLKGLIKEYSTVVQFFKNTDAHYLDGTFPLFEGHQEENTRDWTAQGNEQLKINNEQLVEEATE